MTRYARIGLAVVVLLAPGLAAPAATVAQIIDGNRRVLEGIDDFTTVMVFNVRSASVRVPDTRVRIYFKKPDKFRPEPLDGDFTVLPKTYHLAVGNVIERMAKDHTLRLLREEDLEGRGQYVLKATPNDEGGLVLYHLLYVDRESYTVTRIRTYARNEKPVTLSTTYARYGRGYLPSKATIDGYGRPSEGGAEERIQVQITFGGYKVNVGLSDSVFAEPGKG